MVFVWGHVISSMLNIAWFTQNSVLHFWHDPFLPKKKCELEAHPHWVFHTVHRPVKRSVQICFGIFGGRFPYVSPTSGDIFQPAKEPVAMISTVRSEPHFLTPGTQSHVGWKMMLLSNHGTTINYKHGQKQKHTHKKNVIRLELFKSFVVIAFCVLFHAFSCFCLWLVLIFFLHLPHLLTTNPPQLPKKGRHFGGGCNKTLQSTTLLKETLQTGMFPIQRSCQTWEIFWWLPTQTPFPPGLLVVELTQLKHIN